MANIRLSVPRTAAAGEIIELKALIQHPMESGLRRGSDGKIIPRDIIANFTCLYNDTVVFEAEFEPGISANPFITFHTRATESGRLSFVWTDQDGQQWSKSSEITVI